jgi:cyclopropane fatty-acyl-phospholipid synthase-like methyltransferase
MTYDELYDRDPDYFGVEPVEILKDYCRLIDKNQPALDIGSGTGRNAIFLAQEGIRVDAIDPSSVAVNKLNVVANNRELPVIAYTAGFEDFESEENAYSTVLLFGLIQILRWDEIERLIERISGWCGDGALVFVTAWTVDDPSFERFRNGKQIGRNSFVNKNGIVHTYLEQDETLKLFEDFDTIHHWEGLGPLHSHGDKPPERHGMVISVFRSR